jgi:redox-sensitive bicupin YhaK (pirin superfamily)
MTILHKEKIIVRRSDERGHVQMEWLDTYHTFSFGEYFDPKHVQFRTLRVINEDVVQPSQGFGMHPHRDMEIVTYIVSGTLKHKDNMDNEGLIKAGDVQHMTAGKGVLHGEFNPSDKEAVHLLQIWIVPNKTGLTPSYAQMTLPPLEEGLKLFAADEEKAGVMHIHQNARIYRGFFKTNGEYAYHTSVDRGIWIQVIKGELALKETTLKKGDGVSIENASIIELKAKQDSEFLLFDLK